MKAFLAAAALAVLAACSSGPRPCSNDAGSNLAVCTTFADGGTTCPSGQACAPFEGNTRCMVSCAGGGCSDPVTTCSATETGVPGCGRDAGLDDAGEPILVPACTTDFVCYPNLCTSP